MYNNFDELDEALFNAIDNIKLKEYSKDEIFNIINKAKSRRKMKYLVIRKVAVISIFFIVSVCLIGNRYLKNNENTKSNVKNNEIIIANNNENAKSNVINLYEKNSENSMAENVNLSAKEVYKLATCVALVKIEAGLEGTNYDRMYGPHYNGEYRYTFVRTIGKMKILNIYKGDLNVGDVIEFRKKGGKILYSEYIKPYNENSSQVVDKKLIEEYNKLSKESHEDIYVNVIDNNSIEIEEGKEYLVYFTRKSWGSYWLEPGMVTIREYNSKNDTVLNNYNGEWEPINSVLNGGE